MKRKRTQRWNLIAATAVTVALLAMVNGCPDGSLLGLVGENGEPDTNANLSALTVSQGVLYPPFNPATTEYEVSLDSGVPSVVVTGTAAAAGATVSNNSGTSQTLESGANQITITVTAGDGTTTKAYVVTVNRGAVGVLDTTFDPGLGANSTVRSAGLQDDGKIILAGEFTQLDGTPRSHISRLNTDGSLDAAFDPSTDAAVYGMVIQEDGRIVIGGSFHYVNSTYRQRYARLNSDGSLDASPAPATGADNHVYAVALQSDGKILIGGMFSEVDSLAYNRIARLEADGEVDRDFDSDCGADSSILVITVQDNDKILIGGDFTTPWSHVARLETNGSFDTGFQSGTGPSEMVYAVAVQNDGKVVVGGFFDNVDGTPRSKIARLNADGTVDTTFGSGLGANGDVHAIALQSDGKVIIGGAFTEYDGTPRNRIARLNADGSLDTAFDLREGVGGGSVRTIALQPDGRVVIAGSFTSVDGTMRNRIARLK